jgi:hypothetical protein
LISNGNITEKDFRRKLKCLNTVQCAVRLPTVPITADNALKKRSGMPKRLPHPKTLNWRKTNESIKN